MSELSVRQQIKKVLEQNKGFEMDKKTLKRIVENLESAGLLRTREFNVKIKAQFGKDSETIRKTVLLSLDCGLTDEQLIEDNPTINNPTNRKPKREFSDDEDLEM